MALAKVNLDLRTQLDECKKKLQNIQRLLDAESAEKRELSKIMCNVKNECKRLLEAKNIEVANLHKQVDALTFDPFIPKKHYALLKAYKAKRKRKEKYWDILSKAMINIPECTRAKVILTFVNQDVMLQWTEEEMNKLRSNLRSHGFQISPVFIPVFPQERTEHSLMDQQDTGRNNKRLKITYSQKEIRHTVVTLDAQRISQPAYHELRMELNPLMPPLSLVKKEKKEMSTQLPFHLFNGEDAAYLSIRELYTFLEPPSTFNKQYLLKFATDGYSLTNLHGAVQGCVKLIDVDDDCMPLPEPLLPSHCNGEICVLHFKGEESFENLEKYGGEIFKELQDIDENGMYFDGIHHNIKVTCTCDWKAATILEGLSGPLSTYFCRYCLITSKEKKILKKIKKRKLMRSNAKRNQLMGQKNPKGYIRRPLIHLDAEYCPPDLLHLYKGVILKQIEQVIGWVVTQGNEQKFIDELNLLDVPFRFKQLNDIISKLL